MLIGTRCPKSFAVLFPGKHRFFGCTTFQFTHIAKGGALISLICDICLWDVAAGICIAREAGAVILRPDGSELQPFTMPDDARTDVGQMLVITPSIKDHWQDYFKQITD